MIVPLSQVVLGTDYPWFTAATILGGLANAGLTAAELRGIERECAAPVAAVRLKARFVQ